MATSELRTLVAFLFATLMVACESAPSTEKVIDPVVMMADLHCEAVSLRKARFELADNMRALEDSLMQPAASDSTKRSLQQALNDMEPYKDSIVSGSLELAKVIKFKLDSIIELELTDQEQRAAFDAKLTAELGKRGCQ